MVEMCIFIFQNSSLNYKDRAKFYKRYFQKEKLWDYAKETFPLNGIRRSSKLKFPFNKNNVTEDMVLKIH